MLPKRYNRSRPGWWVLLATAMATLALIVVARPHSHTGLTRTALRPQAPPIRSAIARSSPPWSTSISHSNVTQLPQGPATTPSTTTSTNSPPHSGNPLTESYPGYLSYPDNVTSSFPVYGTGRITAVASWSPTMPLTLSLRCGSRDEASTDTSNATISLESDTPCTLAIDEQGVEPGPIDYTVTVTVAPT